MNTGASPLFLWVDGNVINLVLCQGVYVTETEESGWILCFNMLDESIDVAFDSEEAANQKLQTVYGVMQVHGCAISFPE